MEYRRLHEDAGVRTFAVVFDKGDEFMSGLKTLAETEGLAASDFNAIGALSEATLAFFDRARKTYLKIPVREQVEVLSLLGNITRTEGGEVKVHAHAVVGKADGTTRGGHVLEGKVWPTLEVVVTESPAYLRRRADAETGLSLLAFEPAAEAVGE